MNIGMEYASVSSVSFSASLNVRLKNEVPNTKPIEPAGHELKLATNLKHIPQDANYNIIAQFFQHK